MSEALRDAALYLAIDDQGIDHRSDIVDDDIARDSDRARVGIDFHFADMAAIGKGWRRFKTGCVIEAILKTGQVFPLQFDGKLGYGNGARSPADGKTTGAFDNF